MRNFGDVRGSFELQPKGVTPDGFELFELSKVDLVIPLPLDEGSMRATGIGTFRVRRDLKPAQQLVELDLALDGGKVEHYTSVLEEYRGSLDAVFPDIAASVSINGRVCRDRVFDLRAQAQEERVEKEGSRPLSQRASLTGGTGSDNPPAARSPSRSREPDRPGRGIRGGRSRR